MSSPLKKSLSISFLLILCLMTVRSVGADTAELIKEYEKKLVDIRQQKNTLSTQIQEMDTQMYLTGLTIQRSEAKIIETQSEIEKLGSRIDNLDSSLNTLSKLLLQQITKSYKMRSISLVELLFETKDMNDLTNKIKYLRSSQNNNQKLLIQVQEAKSSYEEQKVIREQKKQELDELIKNLEAQKIALKTQQAEKQKLLVDTNNDEVVYQNLLALAEAQRKGFVSFVETSGGDSIIAANAFGSGSDGAYYSQRDARWASQGIGYSSESILRVGCLLTSIAMFGKKHGDNVTPSDIASNPFRFSGSTAYMKKPWSGVAGKTYSDFYGSRANINQELDNGNYVIVGVYRYSCEAGGNHFVLLTKRDGDDYIMHDPIYGPDLKFSSHYSTICSAATFK